MVQILAGLLCCGIFALISAHHTLVHSNNQFSIKLFNQVATADKNLICSPLSVDVVMTMLLDGSASTTASEIKTALIYDNLVSVDADYTALIPKLKSTTDYTLSLANSIWVNKKYTLKTGYVTNMQTIFGAVVSSFMNGADAVTQINQWVSDNTNKKIPKLFDSLDDSTVTVLVNAIYFLGNWVNPFDAKLTTTSTTFNGKPNTGLQYMYQKDTSFPYKDSTTLKAQVLHLPYKGDDVVLTIVLPHADQTVAAITADANIDTLLTEAFTGLTPTKIAVTIPKFEIETTLDLIPPLKTFGIKAAFDGTSSDFSNMIDGTGMSISQVVQKAYIKVDETGTEAAAATGVVGTLSAVVNAPVFKADHTFIYFLYSQKTESILFMGKFAGV